jgi:hypothetical protein
MIHRVVQFALRQRFLVLMVTMLIIVAGPTASAVCRSMPTPTFRRPWLSSSHSGRATLLKKWSDSHAFQRL